MFLTRVKLFRPRFRYCLARLLIIDIIYILFDVSTKQNETVRSEKIKERILEL